MAEKTVPQLLNNIPPGDFANRSGGPNGNNRQNSATLRDSIARSMTHVAANSDTELVTDDGSGGSTIAVYNIALSAGALQLGGIYWRSAALDDQDLLSDIESYQLDGSAAAALSADGKTCWVALVAVVISGAVELRGVFGDEADDGGEAQVTSAQIKTALVEADPEGLETHVAMVLGRVKIQRVAVDTITMTHIDPAAVGAEGDALAAERMGCGNPFGDAAAA